MPLGDSITEGTQVPGGYRIGLWQRLATGRYRVDFVGSQFNGPASLGDHDHEGHPGWRIDQIDANIVGWLRTTNPRTVLLHIGTNDMCRTTTSGAPTRLSTLIDHITNTARTRTCSSPRSSRWPARTGGRGPHVQRGDPRHRAEQGQRRQARTPGRHAQRPDHADLTDGIHPTATGYDKMAAAWYDALRRAGSIGGDTPTHHAPPTTPPTTPPASDGCRVAYTVNAWNTVSPRPSRVTNTSSTPVNGWALAFTLPGWADHHQRLERQLRPVQRSGDRPQRLLQRDDRAEHLGRHRFPGDPRGQHRPTVRVHPQRHRLHGRLTPSVAVPGPGGPAALADP